MKWIVTFSALCLGMTALILGLLWGMSGFQDIGLQGRGLVALVAGVFLSSALGAGLMALVFYSGRSGQDDAVYRIDRKTDVNI
jgi:hypothetical protein